MGRGGGESNYWEEGEKKWRGQIAYFPREQKQLFILFMLETIALQGDIWKELHLNVIPLEGEKAGSL